MATIGADVLESLPAEVIEKIADFCDPTTRSRFCRTRQALQPLLEGHKLYWKSQCERISQYAPISHFDYDWYRCYFEYMRHIPSSTSRSTNQGSGRLLVTHLSEVSVHTRDGSWSSHTLAHSSQTERRTQPTWSRDGRFISWSRIVAREGAVASIFVDIVDSATGAIRTWSVSNPPFYHLWSPDSSKLIYLCADDLLQTHYIDVFQDPPSDSDEDQPNHSTQIYTSAAHFFTPCPVPGVERILGNVPGSSTHVLGISGAIKPLYFGMDAIGAQDFEDHVVKPSNAPPVPFEPQYEVDTEPPALGSYTTPYWTLNNTMVVGTLIFNKQHMLQVRAFDTLWDPRYNGQKISKYFEDGGVEAVSRLMQEHSDADDVRDGSFTLPMPLKSVVLFESETRIKFVVSPNGNLVCCISRRKVEIIRLIFEESAGRTTKSEKELRFSPKRVIDKKVTSTLEIDPFGVFFAPDSSSILILVQENRNFRWKSLRIPENDERNPIVSYTSFWNSPVLIHHYLPFNSQYAVSMQMHSPDSSCFAYPADGKIWIQNLHFTDDAPPDPVALADGEFCAWAPY